MNRFLLPPAMLAAFALAPSVAADDQTESVGDSQEMVTSDGASPVRLVSWDGDFELLKTSRRLRIWRSHLAYRMTVDEEGNATECELTETFRRAYVSERLCDVLMAHHTFEPAHDESGAPVEGSYTARISYMELRERQ